MSDSSSSRSAWAGGLTVFAAVILITVGVFQVLEAIVALANDEFYIVGPKFTYEFDLTTWGWIHLIIGLLLILVGLALFSRNIWARGAAIGIAALSMIANFMWLPYYPFWAIVLIGLNVAVIWALAVSEAPEQIEAP